MIRSQTVFQITGSVICFHYTMDVRKATRNPLSQSTVKVNLPTLIFITTVSIPIKM